MRESYVIIRLFLGLALRDTLYYVTTTFFQVPKKCIQNKFSNTLLTGTFKLCTKMHYNYCACWVLIFGLFSLWYVSIMYWNNVTATFRFRLSLWRIFTTSQLRYLFVQRVTVFDGVRITLNYGNCLNVWIV